MASRTCPSGLGPLTSGPTRQLAAARRMAAICSTLSACGDPFGLFSGEVPSTGLRPSASWRREYPKNWLSSVRVCLAPRRGETPANLW